MSSQYKMPDGAGVHEHVGGDRTQPRRLFATDLTGGGREAIIEHLGQEYRLRITSNGKLILTK